MEERRLFTIGERVWDDTESRWGKVMLLKHSNANPQDMLKPDDFVTYTSDGKPCTALATDCYQLAEGHTLQGNELCWEHRETPEDYPFYCPEREENVFFFETDNQKS